MKTRLTVVGERPQGSDGSGLQAATLRGVVNDFVARCFDDSMIGFFFQASDMQKVQLREFEHAAEALGVPGVTYRGRPLDRVHKPRRIMGGQFERRIQILRETLADHGVATEIQERWVANNLALRDRITADTSGECVGR